MECYTACLYTNSLYKKLWGGLTKYALPAGFFAEAAYDDHAGRVVLLSTAQKKGLVRSEVVQK